MASSALTGSLLKAVPAVARRSPGGMRALVTGGPGTPGPFEGIDPQMKDSAGPVENVATETRGMASSTAARQKIEEEADSMEDHMVDKVENISEKAKQTVQDVWESAKDTAQKVKDTVVGKAEDAKDFMKEMVHEGEDKIKTGIKADEMEGKSAINSVKAKACKQAANHPEIVGKAMNTKDC